MNTEFGTARAAIETFVTELAVVLAVVSQTRSSSGFGDIERLKWEVLVWIGSAVRLRLLVI